MKPWLIPGTEKGHFPQKNHKDYLRMLNPLNIAVKISQNKSNLVNHLDVNMNGYNIDEHADTAHPHVLK